MSLRMCYDFDDALKEICFDLFGAKRMRITRKDIRLSCGHYLISGVICIRHMLNIIRLAVIRSYFQMVCL